MISTQEALEQLKDGNSRFVSGNLTARTGFRRIPEQKPMAVILGCADSRVPAEIVFDQAPGDLFVIRVAGNVVAPSQLGSVEYAAAQTGARLVVVLGHSNCGAVNATLHQMEQPSDSLSPSLATIIDRIRPALDALVKPEDPEELVTRAVRANIDASVAQLRSDSELLQQLAEEDGLLIIGAEYSLDTGRVEFL